MKNLLALGAAAFLTLFWPAAAAAQTLGPAPVTQQAVGLCDTQAACAAARFTSATNFVRTAGYASSGDGGAALYVRVGSMPSHAARFQSADGTWWELVPGEKGVNARSLGATGSGVTDDTVAAASTLTAAMALNRPAYFPAGTYKITAALDAGSPGADGAQPNKVSGDGRDLTVISQATDNTPIVKLGGAMGYLRDMTLTYANRQTSANPSAVGIELYAYRWSSIERVKVANAYRALAIKQAAIYSGANWISNVSMRDMYFENFTGSAMFLSSYNGGSGGVRLDNIYAYSRDGGGLPQVTETTYYFESFSEVVGDNLHAESSKPSEAFFFGQVGNVILNGTHIEGLSPTTDFGGLIHLTGSNAVINGTTVDGNSFLLANLPNQYSIFRLDAASTLTANGLKESSSTATTAHPRQFSVSGGSNAIFKRSFSVSSFTDEGVFANPYEFKMRDDLARPITVSVSGDRGDASSTAVAGTDPETLLYGTPLTADRTVTLSTTQAWEGAEFTIVRTASATGSFNLNVVGNSTKALTPGTWATFRFLPTGTWQLVAAGSL